MLLYETLSQPKIFLIVLGVGFLCGTLFDFRSYIFFLCNKNKVVGFVCDFIASLLCCFVFFLCLGKFNFGVFRFYLALGFLSGLLFERFSVGLIIAKFGNWCYTFFKRLIQKIYGRKKKKN